MESKIIVLKAKNDAILKRVARLFESMNRVSISADLRSTENFMAETETLAVIRNEFISNLDSINEYSLQSVKDFTPDFEILNSFEETYTRIERTRSLIIQRSAARTTSRPDAKGASTPTPTPALPQIKLPAIEIPSFDGKVDNWPVFYECFKANVHSNAALTDAQRVHYLMGKLSGSALKLTAGIIPSGENYPTIWDSLVQKYQDKRALGAHYMALILNMKPAANNSASLNSYVESFHAAVSALEQLKIEDLKDFIFLTIAMRKIDATTAQSFEMLFREKEIPSYKDFINFVKGQVKILDRTAAAVTPRNTQVYSHPNNAPTKPTFRAQTSQSFVTRSNNNNHACAVCNTETSHQLYFCAAFKAMTPKVRLDLIKSKHGCVNCLSLTHTAAQCNSAYSCKTCNKRHHSMLHLDYNNSSKQPQYTTAARPALRDVARPSPQPQDQSRPYTPADVRARAAPPPPPAATNAAPAPAHSPGSPHVVSLCAREGETASRQVDVATRQTTVLLSTARVEVTNNNKQNVSLRCLLDNASQNNIITSACCERLNLKPIQLANSFIKGIGSASQAVSGYVQLQISAKNNESSFTITALVLDAITERMPCDFVDTSVVQHLGNLPLADPLWHVPGEIELLLGAQLFPFLILGGRVIAPPAPPAIETVFGYVFMGEVPVIRDPSGSDSCPASFISATFFTCTNGVNCESQLDGTLRKFWELEEIPQKRFFSPEEIECEGIYSTTVSRDPSTGRYCTALPFCRNPSELGDSRCVAQRRLLSLERKLQEPALRTDYNNVIQDYIDNDYLTEVEPSDADYGKGYFIPHHAVIRNDKQTSKVRVVLDASAKCHNGVSLNDTLHTGPNLQADILILLLNFRLFPIALTADIKQMYLRIALREEHQKYQKILFRFDPLQPIKEFKFKRVAFGLKCSPFLAMRTVRQLAADEQHRFPRAAQVATRELYMDDLTTSTLTQEEAGTLSAELIDLFKAGGFNLTKWASNSPQVLETVPQSNRAAIEFDEANLKILGLKWLPALDVFTFSTSPVDEQCTKRTILSTIARLWDVLGFAAPVVLFAKLLIKGLWAQCIGWDEPPPADVVTAFDNFKEQLPALSNLQIPRHLGVGIDSTTNIVAFADASLRAYGCVVYLHVVDSSGNVSVTMVCAKSKVAPAKVVSLARLELCAAVLMSKLVKLVHETYSARTPINNICAFSDSTIALSWINSSPHRWNIFVSNRVAMCQENLDPRHFYHVNGAENPSDCLSRGLLPEQLVSHELWWHGPEWLKRPVTEWPIAPFTTANKVEELPEYKSKTLTCTAAAPPTPGILYDLASKFSSWNRILRIIVRVLMFGKIIPRSDRISSSQLNTAETYLIREVQRVHFEQLIRDLKNAKLPCVSLRKLDPFIDESGIIRIGGRLSNSNLPFEAKYPALLPKHDHVTHLLVDYYHRLHCHTGSNLLSSLIRQRFWILSARSVIRQRVHSCNYCFKTAPSHSCQKMADLPSYRVKETKAFVHTGIDYAGPITITPWRRRGQRTQKAYICLFVCLITKAVHIELATDLSSDTFVSAFKRFLSRRGPVSCLYSDNGTNFVGAKSQLRDLVSNHRIEWKMIPPRAPHFGGLWESNIKSMKTHLYRVIGTQILTYEEMATVLAQIESILNSRPLCILTADPYPEPLTPAHFIMASPLTYLPLEPISLSEEPKSLHLRKQLLDKMVVDYWKRWRLEYLNNLQVRQKWLTETDNIKINTVVLVHQDDVPPLRWPLGIIQEVYPGKDGKVRVALVKTATNSFKRPIVKLCPLPTQ